MGCSFVEMSSPVHFQNEPVDSTVIDLPHDVFADSVAAVNVQFIIEIVGGAARSDFNDELGGASI
jgi:hypothetical protein